MPGPAPEFYVEEKRPHLGGYIAGGDPATYFPDLWDWLVFARGVKSVIDVGCGEGRAARYFADAGCDVIGIDGVWQLSENWRFYMHDYTKGPWPTEVRGNRMEGATDLVWSCEFVEHVEERYVPNFLTTFQMASTVLMTHAGPGQPGHHHVNCQPAAYWIGALAAAGFLYDDELTSEARARAALNRHPSNHFTRSGLVFRRP
jgi:SAM-dependent methyltransferase